MAAYRFRLETVLDYRRNLEDMARQKLAAEEARLAGLERELETAARARRRTDEEFEECKKRPMSAARFARFVETLQYQQRRADELRERLAAQRRAVEAARAALAARARERKVMEKARERDYRRYLKEEARRELGENDEMAVLRHGRNTTA
jgi:flagellar FliJ protein